MAAPQLHRALLLAFLLVSAAAAAAAASHPQHILTRLDPSSPPSLVATGAPSSASLAPQAEKSGSSASESGVAAPPPVVENPYRDATSPPPPVHDDFGHEKIAKVLALLGYNDMASSARLLPDTPAVAAWPGAITIFAAPDVFLEHHCPDCSRRHLLLDHMALGYFSFADLAAAPPTNLPSAYVGLCLDVDDQRQGGAFSVDASLYVNGVVVSEPLLYDDGRYVVHGLHGFIPPLSHASCVEDPHALDHQIHLHQHRRRRHLSARSATTSDMRFMIRDAVSRLRDSGFGFVALAMRMEVAELQRLPNLTLFALDDHVIFAGGGHGYVSAVRFHIVPGHRLTRADLLLLRPGTVLPTMAGEGQKLVITIGAGSATDEVRINYVLIKVPDVAVNSRVAAHGIAVPFPASTSPTSTAAASGTVSAHD